MGRYLRAARCLLISIIFLFSISAQAQISPEVGRGLSWLQAQVQADGSLIGETTSIATPLQSRSEALFTLKLLGAPSSTLTPLQTLLGSDSEMSTEYLARRAWALGYSGNVQPALLEQIQSLQNMSGAIGGYGGGAGYTSQALDTAFVLLAQKTSGASNTNAVASALAFLNENKAIDGSFAVNRQANLYVTVNALLAAAAWSNQTNTGAITAPAQQWLLSQRNASSHFGSTLNNALSLWALTGQTSQTAILQPLVDALKADQLANGSWNDDPYLTAIALRGLFLMTQLPSTPTTAAMNGSVVDASNANALGDVVVRIITGVQNSVATSASGSFSFVSVAPGTHTVRFSKLGYASKDIQVTLTAGQSLNVGSIAMTPATLVASLSGVVKNQSGTVLPNVTIAVGTASALTDAQGVYQITDLSPGAANITATMAGYQTANAMVTFAAGTNYTFSPRLTANNTTPPTTTTVSGVVIDAITKQGLAGVTVKLNSLSQVTGAGGIFAFSSITAGEFVLTITANGYQSLSASGVSVAGVNAVGNLGLIKLPATSTISGVITDVVSNLPIRSASVSVQGQGTPVITGVDGKYSIGGLTNLNFTLNVTADNYFPQSQQVALAQVGAATVDVKLQSRDTVGSSDISFIKVATISPSFSPSGVIPLELVLANSTNSDVSLQLSAQVFNAQNSIVHEYFASPVIGWQGATVGNNPVAVVANGTLESVIDWNTVRLAAGEYIVRARATDVSGRVLAEGDTSFTVKELASLAGGVTADPPLAQAGAKTPISFTGDLINSGNIKLPAGELKLRVILDTPDTTENSQAQISLQTFAVGAPMKSAAKLTTDLQGNLYTVNSSEGKVIKIDTSGTQFIVATLPSGSYADVVVDVHGNIWVVNENSKKLYKISPVGELSTFSISSLSRFYGLDISSSGLIFLSGLFSGTENGKTISNEARLVQLDSSGVETVLWRNGLSTPVAMVKDNTGNYVVTNSSDGTLVKVSAATGVISPFVSGLNQPKGITVDAAGNFYVANSGNNTVVKISSEGVASVHAAGFNQPYDLKFDASGNLFVSNAGDDSILKVLSSGEVQLFAKGIANTPQGMKYDASGNLWIANGDGTLRKKDTQDKVTIVATGLSAPRGMVIADNGDVLIAEYGSGKVSRISNGVKSTFASGLSGPFGVAIDLAGNVYVTEQSVNRITRFDAAGNKLGVTEALLNSPTVMRAALNGDIYIQNSGFLSVKNSNGMQIAQRNFNYSYWAPDNNGGVIALSGYSLVRISATGTVSTIKANLLFSPYGVALDAVGNIVINDYSNKKLHKLDLDGNLSELVTLPSNVTPGELRSDSAGNLFVRLANNLFYSVSTTGTLSLISPAITEHIYGWNTGNNGRLLVWTYSKIYSIDIATGVPTVLVANRGYYNNGRYISGAAVDGVGNLVLSDNGNNNVSVYSNGVELSQLSGFVGLKDIVWAGSELRFVDGGNRLYGFNGDAYPIVKAGTLPTQYLAQSGSDTLGANTNTAIYKWTGAAGNGYDIYTTISGTNFAGIAAKGDGSIAVASTNDSRVLVLDVAKTIVKDYAGIISPQGLVFDQANRLYVANSNGGTIARFDSLTNPLASTFAKVSSPQHLAFDSLGQLFVAKSYGVDRLALDGKATTITAPGYFKGLLIDGSSVLAIEQSNNQVRKLSEAGDVWNVVATGFSKPVAIRAADNGDVFVLSQNNNSVVRYHDGTLNSFASIPAGMNALDIGNDGALTVVGNNGVVNRITSGGVVSDLKIGSLVSALPLYGVVESNNGKTYFIGNDPSTQSGSIFEMSVSQPVVPPAAGTVVFQTTKPMADMPANGTYHHVDLGTWIPPYGGDYKVELWRDGIDGKATNFIHVGSNAQSLLSAAQAELPAGDSSLSMCLDLKGADFTTISRVEMGQVRPVSRTAGTPKGMAGDKVGNVYVTDETSLYRTNVAGQNTLIAGGMSLAFGLATDTQQNFYVASRNATTGRFELIRIDLQGVKTVVADLGVTTANGVQINSKDEVLIGSRGKLLKVDQKGVVSVVTTAGFPNPRGIAVDGRDNVYVQNESDFVSMIKPDGSSTTVFSKGDGVIDPQFEGDGYPNIAADCADNFYIAPYAWKKNGIEPSEEHLLAQVVQRTGRVAVLFDTLKIDPTIGDVDYLSFDRFSNRVLMWNDGDKRIWQVPVTCGAIGVQAHLLAKPGQTFTGASKPPSATVPHADGSTEYVWSLRDVTAQGSQVCFNASQTDVKLGEERKAIESGFISFQNSFAPGDVTVPLSIPVVRAANLVTLNVAADQIDYAANATAQVSTSLTNNNINAVTGTLNVQVFDSRGVLVGSVTQQGVSLPASESLPVVAPFNIGSIIPAQYTVKAALSGANGDLAMAQTVFNVLPSNSDATAKSTVNTDRSLYKASDRVLINSRVVNQSANIILDNLTLMVSVYDASNALQFTHGHAITQLLPGARRDFTVTQTLRNLPEGQYIVKQTLSDSAGRMFDQPSAAYVVESSASSGFGLLGTIVLSAKEVPFGSNVNFNFSATNKGNSALVDLPLKVSIVDPVSQKIVAEYPYKQTLAIAASYEGAGSWTAAGAVGQNYVAVLSANVGSVNMTLAQANLTVIAPLIVVRPFIATDKMSYAPSDNVLLHASVTNLTPNLEAKNLDVIVKVTNPDGTVRFTKTEALAQLGINGVKDYHYNLLLTSAPAGKYLASVQVISGGQVVGSANPAEFIVLSTADSGSGLTGMISATPKQIEQGEAVVFTFTAINAGNSHLKNLPLKVSIVESTSNKIVLEFPYTQTINIGASYSAAVNWSATAAATVHYDVVLNASIGGKTLNLAKDSFEVIAAKIKLNITQQQGSWQNLLVYSACKRAADDVLGQCGAKTIPIESAASLASCDNTRATALNAYLNRLSVAHKVTSSPVEFLQNLRSGLYNSYWISNGATAMLEPTVSEVSAAVYRGHGLLIDGLSDSRNLQLTQCAGINYQGKYTVADQMLNITGDLLNPSTGAFRITALPVKLSAINGATAQAKLGTSPMTDGIISGLYGSGKTLTYSFDLAETLRAQTQESRWLALTQKSFGYLEPAITNSNQYSAGQIFTIVSKIKNEGQAAELQLSQTLPVGAQIIATEPAANQAGTTATWRLNLLANVEQEFKLRLRAPDTPGNASIVTTTSVIKDTVATVFKTQNFDIVVESADQLLTQLISRVTDLSLTTPEQLAAQRTILTELNRTKLALAATRFDEALRLLLTVQSRIKLIDGGGTQASSLAHLIGAVEWQRVK